MVLRLAALLIAIAAILLVAFNTYNSPKDYGRAIADCRNDILAPNDAISACTKLIEHPDVSDENLHFFLGKRAWAFRRADDYENAISDTDQALRMQPDNINTWVRRAYINDASGAIEAAAEDFSKALELDPDRISTLMHRAKLLNLRGDYEKALQDYEQVLLHEPLNDMAAGKRIGIHIKLKNYDLAIYLLNQAAAIWPEKHYIQEALGRLYHHHSEDYEKSLQAFARLAELEPSDLHGLFFPGMVHLKFGAERRGVEYIERYAERVAKDVPSGEGFISRSIVGPAQNVLLGESPQFLYRGITYSAAGRPDLAQIEFERHLGEGGVIAAKLLRDLLDSYGFYNTSTTEKGSDDKFDEALKKYIEHLGSIFSLEALGHRL